ncbi:hypothetical protein [Sphingomicrobium nitratireducens]|uniref:hypothetical protein n=1 Tax=Sphingomicrobium nitratireducens TaxID=2964666 RepID=UPI00223F750F|nr:hypothetical protein [Sphingomicrobium nitratireducens]
MRAKILMLLPPALLLAACGGEVEPETVETMNETAAEEGPVEVETTVDGTSSYTTLAECEVLSDDRHEGGTLERQCEGPAGYAMRVLESDLDVDVSIVPPEGDPVALDLPTINSNGMSFLGGTVEWRGVDGQPPRALIMRHIVENGAQDPMGPETSWLMVAAIGDPTCLVARVPPGPGQNVAARRFADRDSFPDCLEPVDEKEAEPEG